MYITTYWAALAAKNAIQAILNHDFLSPEAVISREIVISVPTKEREVKKRSLNLCTALYPSEII